jgi:hypothetical protein
MVATMPQTQVDKRAFFKGQDDVKADLLPPYVGRVLDWDYVERDEKKFGSDERHTVLYFQLTIDPLDTAYLSEDGLAKPMWKTSRTQQGNIRPGSTEDTLIQSLAKGMQALGHKDFRIKTVESYEALKGQVLLFGQVDPTTDERFAKVKADIREKMKATVMCLGAPPAGWEDAIPADLDAQKAAKMDQAIKRNEERRQSREAGEGETVESVAIQTVEEAPSVEMSEETQAYVLAWLDGKEFGRIGPVVYGDKDLKANVPAEVFAALQNRKIQTALKEAGLVTEGKDGRYHLTS